MLHFTPVLRALEPRLQPYKNGTANSKPPSRDIPP
nr:MAG TPA: hypothetical protein [Caudoviricetes sp.]